MPAPRSLPGLPADYTSKLFNGDLVTKVTDPDFRGKVLRCWANEEGDLPDSAYAPRHGIDRPLLRGEVGIADTKTGALQIVPESSLSLRQRDFLVGDIVKRSLMHVESGVVIDTGPEVRLTKLISGDVLPGWISYSMLKSSLVLDQKDKVVCDEWLGTVEEIVEEAVVEGKDGKCYTFVLGGGTLGPGKIVQDVINKSFPPHFEQFNDYHKPALPPQANPSEDVIIEVRPILLLVTWHVINQMLSVQEQDLHPEPQSVWYGKEIEKLTHFEQVFVQPPQVGSTVVFRNESDESKFGFEPSLHHGGRIKLRSLKVADSRSKARVKWQDCTETVENASDLVPHNMLDDYESWPGDHVMWRGDQGEKRPAVVQHVDSRQRIADLFFPDTSEKQTVSVMEIDLGGPDKPHYGVGIGLPILLCKDNFVPPPEVPSVGRFETPMANMVLRDELARKALSLSNNRPPEPEVEGIRPKGDVAKINWYGSVINTELDGTIRVRTVNGESKTVAIKEVQLLGDPTMIDHMDFDMDMMDESDGMSDVGDIPMPLGLGMMGGFAFPMMGNGQPTVVDLDTDMHSEASWETMSGDEEGDRYSGSGRDDNASVGPNEDHNMLDSEQSHFIPGVIIDEEEQERRDVEEVDPLVSPGRSELISLPDEEQPEAGPSSHVRQLSSSQNGTTSLRGSLEDDEQWERFAMLEEAPADHHFIREAPLSGNRSFNSRIAKEHRALMSSLPENILVRTYENRTDLLRVLIIGPEGTPYADAPFVFDVYLNPTKFPHEPPVVHFHSHTFGKGRCNPNLYEEGKVCLSVLGTWSGEASESWDPARSSLLQVFVSISGLVLVRSPYHCEPAFAKLEGTREGRVNSRLYSEKAYVLSRSFVRTALDRPPSGLEKEIRHLYIDKGRLESVINHAQRLIRKGEEEAARGQNEVEEEDEQMWNADAVGSLTIGAILTLKRTITILERMLHENQS